ncbi:MAG: glycosyltransferase family 4 protein [Rickettsiales bacterium]|jgi:glycosyltransferase involved in cell wall biosynthesis|nr:glycosyltransferase family 4 protein [Rickettsiales bacterium]
MSKKKVKTSHNIVRKPGILQVLPALMSGGVERQVMDTAEAIVKAGYRSFLASSGGSLVNSLYQQGSRHFVLELDSKNPFVILKNIFRLREIIELNNIDIVHAQSRAPAWSAYYAAKLAKCHFVTTIHGAHSTTGLFKKLYNSVMTKGEKVIAVSKFIAQYAKDNYKFDHKKLEVIHCGTNIDKFNYSKVGDKRIIDIARNLRIPTDKPIIMLPGRLVRNKGHLFLLEAIRELPSQSVTCLFVGGGKEYSNYRKELQDKIKEYGLSKTVIMTSNVSDMPAIYGLSDIVVCASTKPESFGLVSIEAQAMGRMVIATNIGGIVETIISKKTGWLIEPNNVEQLTETIKNILQMDLSTRLVHAKAARNNVEKKFSLETMGKKIINTYNKVLGI